ncbi:MAG: hypothetical protein PHI90_07310 [Clostridia bacterium]|nr:hypothetical protein [Clostridia bacterium]MDD4048609.1 hypothetical protein [Clostridia bacterium]
MPKIIYLILISLLLLVVMFDTNIYFTSISNFRDAIDQALDASLIAGMEEDSVGHGKMGIKNTEIENTKAYQAARESLRKNLQLDNSLESSLYSDSNFEFTIESNPLPIAKGKFSTKIHLLCLKILQIKGVPYSISKNQEFSSEYVY